MSESSVGAASEFVGSGVISFLTAAVVGGVSVEAVGVAVVGVVAWEYLRQDLYLVSCKAFPVLASKFELLPQGGGLLVDGGWRGVQGVEFLPLDLTLAADDGPLSTGGPYPHRRLNLQPCW